MGKRINLNWISKLEYGRCFIAVRDDIIAARYEHAMTAVDRMFAIYREKKPSKKVKIQLNLIFGMVSWNLKQYDDVYLACRTALDQICDELVVERNKKIVNELKYLRGYCKTLVGFSDAASNTIRNHDFPDIDNLIAPDYDLKQVSDFLKRTFPIDDTSWWNSERVQ